MDLLSVSLVKAWSSFFGSEQWVEFLWSVRFLQNKTYSCGLKIASRNRQFHASGLTFISTCRRHSIKIHGSC